MTTKLGAYVRVSDVAGREGDSFISPELQWQGIDGWLASHPEYEVPADARYEELDRSGKDFDRELWRILQARVDSGELAGVIVRYLDRFGRDYFESTVMLKEMHDTGGFVLAVDIGGRSDDPKHRQHVQLMLMFADMTLQRITQGWKTVHDKMHERKMFHGRTPFGYDRTVRTATIDAEASVCVREAFLMRARGETVSAIRAMLSERTDEVWSDQRVNDLLKNPVYRGELRSGKREPVSIPAIVTREEWEAAQRPRMRGRLNSTAPLVGILKCAACGRNMVTGVGGTKAKRIPTYRCKNPHCTDRVVIVRASLESYVEGIFLERHGAMVAQASQLTHELTEAQALVEQVQRRITAHMSDADLRELDPDAFSERTADLKTQKARAQEQLASAQARLNLSGLANVPMRGHIQQASDLAKRELYAAAFDAVLVRRTSAPTLDVASKVTVIPAGSGIELPRVGSHNRPRATRVSSS